MLNTDEELRDFFKDLRIESGIQVSHFNIEDIKKFFEGNEDHLKYEIYDAANKCGEGPVMFQIFVDGKEVLYGEYIYKLKSKEDIQFAITKTDILANDIISFSCRSIVSSPIKIEREEYIVFPYSAYISKNILDDNNQPPINRIEFPISGIQINTVFPEGGLNE